MAKREHIDEILRNWEYDPKAISVRLTRGSDGRDLIQMRVDMGLLQLETEGRPDGARPQGAETYFDHLLSEETARGRDFAMSEEECGETDREFVQFYHRRVCWLALRRFRQAVADADHTLGLMDFCLRHSPDEQWTMSHEQYRPFVLFHRTQAAAMARLEEDGPEAAVNELNQGLDELQRLFARYDAEDEYEEDELVNRLRELREEIRQRHEVGRTLQEQLADAVAQEKYELAAELRDKLARREPKR